MVPMPPRLKRGSRDRGAAAVEFALVVPVLFLILFGVIDYGRFFFDSISLRHGAREATRQAVVQMYAPSCTGTVGEKIACSAKIASDSTMGTPLVRIPALSGTWAQGKQLLVCMQSRENGTGFVPLPGGGMGYGFLKTKVYMSIEVDTIVDPKFITDTAPAGSDWTSWCL